MKEKMHSRELGLVLAKRLLDVEDLHYGLWDPSLELKLANLPIAQQRYNEMLMAQLPEPNGEVRVLDIGCGAGHLLRQLLDRGYRADGVIPARDLAEAVRGRLADFPGYRSRLFECRLEDLPLDQCRRHYDVALFSESFQYIPLAASLPRLQEILKSGGLLVICDFFKTEALGDGVSGDRSFGGGHPLREFTAAMQRTPFVAVKDEDITQRVSPNMDLVNDVLIHRLKPAVLALGSYLEGRYPLVMRLAMKLFRRKLEKVNYKYFSGHRSKEVFERYKTYRLLVYRLP